MYNNIKHCAILVVFNKLSWINKKDFLMIDNLYDFYFKKQTKYETHL